jgi:AraC-like DNA-binding protein
MLGSAQNTLQNPNEFQIALRDGGEVDLVVPAAGDFAAHLSKISVPGMRLFACEERMSRIAFMSIATGLVRITLPPQPNGSLIWDGFAARPGEIVTHSGGLPFHERTDGPCRWSTVWLRAKDLADAGRATRGATFMLPPGERRWRPLPGALRSLVNLHGAAMRATAARPKLPVETKAARGLQQQMVVALAECLTREAFGRETSSTRRRHTDTMVRFEEAFRGTPFERMSVARMAVALGVSNTALRTCCHQHLGMTPARYLHLRRMELPSQTIWSA